MFCMIWSLFSYPTTYFSTHWWGTATWWRLPKGCWNVAKGILLSRTVTATVQLHCTVFMMAISNCDLKDNNLTVARLPTARIIITRSINRQANNSQANTSTVVYKLCSQCYPDTYSWAMESQWPRWKLSTSRSYVIRREGPLLHQDPPPLLCRLVEGSLAVEITSIALHCITLCNTVLHCVTLFYTA